MKSRILGLALGAALFGAASAHASLFIIDNFQEDPQTVLIAPGAPGVQSNMVNNPGGSEFLADGGTRTLSTNTTGGLGGTAAILNGGMGFFNLGANSTTFTTATVVWQTAAGEAGDKDITDGGTADFLIFGVDSLDHPLIVTVELFDGVNTATNTYYKHDFQVTPGSQPAGLPCTGTCPDIIGGIFGDTHNGEFANYYHALSSFLGGAPTNDPAQVGFPAFGGNPALDLTSIDRITFSLTTTGDGLDFLVDCLHTGTAEVVGTQSFGGQDYPVFGSAAGDRNACQFAPPGVPEPGTLLLMGTGILGLGLVGMRTRMRRRQA
ncbi:MAG: PEP-CTERM sorting domain-containing protein [Candidatus Tectimicrobiota bacterium]